MPLQSSPKPRYPLHSISPVLRFPSALVPDSQSRWPGGTVTCPWFIGSAMTFSFGNPAAWLVDRLYHKPIVPCPVLPLQFSFSGSSLYSSTVEDLRYLSTRVFPNGLRSSQSYGFTRPRDLSSVCTAQCRFAFLRVTQGCTDAPDLPVMLVRPQLQVSYPN